MFDISAEAEWKQSSLRKSIRRRAYLSKITSNRRLVQKLAPGSIVIIPRPARGVLYLGVIKDFELSNAPKWAKAYLELREANDLEITPEEDHIGDVVQGWPIQGEFVRVPFTAAPRWLTTQLLSRTTAGIVKDCPGEETSAFGIAQDLLASKFSLAGDWTPTIEASAVHTRLLRALGPAAFEQLACELLALEAGDRERWTHVGGSGDGGADGLAFSPDGRCTAGLTCKLRLGKDPAELGEELHTDLASAWKDTPVRVVVAWLTERKSLKPPPRPAPKNVEFLDGLAIARLLIKHRARCAIAHMVGVGVGGETKT